MEKIAPGVTTKSTLPWDNACSASSGRLMIGSSCALKDVLMTTGIPVRLS
jgi:hypothetical protein